MQARQRMSVAHWSDEELLEHFWLCAHSVTLGLRQSEAFEEWSLMEIRALRVFERTCNHVSGATEIARAIDCTIPYATKLIRRLASKGLVREGLGYLQLRSWVLTGKGLARLRSNSAELDVFARRAFEGLSEDERAMLVQLLRSVRGNVSLPRRGHETYWI